MYYKFYQPIWSTLDCQKPVALRKTLIERRKNRSEPLFHEHKVDKRIATVHKNKQIKKCFINTYQNSKLLQQIKSFRTQFMVFAISSTK